MLACQRLATEIQFPIPLLHACPIQANDCGARRFCLSTDRQKLQKRAENVEDVSLEHLGPVGLNSVLNKALAADQNARFSTAEDFSAALLKLPDAVGELKIVPASGWPVRLAVFVNLVLLGLALYSLGIYQQPTVEQLSTEHSRTHQRATGRTLPKNGEQPPTRPSRPGGPEQSTPVEGPEQRAAELPKSDTPEPSVPPKPQGSASELPAKPPTVEPPPPTLGRVEVVTRPKGATVFLDGKRIGKSPIVISDIALNRSYRMRLEKRNYQDREKRFKLTASKPQKVFKLRMSEDSSGNVDLDPEEGPATVITIAR